MKVLYLQFVSGNNQVELSYGHMGRLSLVRERVRVRVDRVRLADGPSKPLTLILSPSARGEAGKSGVRFLGN
jgi:hypothetical protein